MCHNTASVSGFFFWLWGVWDLTSLASDRTHFPCIGRRCLNRWTPREVPHWERLTQTWERYELLRKCWGEMKLQRSRFCSYRWKKSDFLPFLLLLYLSATLAFLFFLEDTKLLPDLSFWQLPFLVPLRILFCQLSAHSSFPISQKQAQTSLPTSKKFSPTACPKITSFRPCRPYCFAFFLALTCWNSVFVFCRPPLFLTA